MITYRWEIVSKQIEPEVKGKENVILAVLWKYIGADKNNNSFYWLETSFFPLINTDNFIPYEEITDDIIILWIESKADIVSIQKEIKDKITAQATTKEEPPKVVKDILSEKLTASK